MTVDEETHRLFRSAQSGLTGVVYIMGAARSGSTLLGTLIGQAPDAFYAGELTDWPGRAGRSSIPRSVAFWERVRAKVAVPASAERLKRVFDHPAGIALPRRHRKLRADYERVTLEVLAATAEASGCPIVVDSSHYPRRAAALRRMMAPGAVRLVFMVRRPSSVARSLRSDKERSELGIQLYLFVVGVLAWLVYLTHPRRSRALVSYETLVEAPIGVASAALGTPIVGVDPVHLTPPPIFIGNRFARDSGPVSVERPTPRKPRLADRVIDLLQWPLGLACMVAARRPKSVRRTGGPRTAPLSPR